MLQPDCTENAASESESCTGASEAKKLTGGEKEWREKLCKKHFQAIRFFFLQLRFFAYSLFRCMLDADSHCKQTTSSASKKTPNSKHKSPNCQQKTLQTHNCKQRNSIVSRKLPIVSKKAASKKKDISPVRNTSVMSGKTDPVQFKGVFKQGPF